MTHDLRLRDVRDDDLAVFFEQQLDEQARHMAAFTSADPTDRAAFTAHWRRILADPTVVIRTITVDGEIAGSVLRYETDGRPEVSYWLGRAFWGRGIASRALAEFLAHHDRSRPMRARVAADNLASRRVLERCGFTVLEESMGFAQARGEEIAELLLELRAPAADEP